MFVCLFTILLTGCYSHTILAKDDPPEPPGVEVSFRLHNGIHILSHEHKRVEDGFQIVGKLITKDNKHSKDFSGIRPGRGGDSVVRSSNAKAAARRPGLP